MASTKIKITVTSRSAIDTLFKKALPCLNKHGIKILKVPTNKQGKILLIVSAKSGNAVARNLFKRRVKSVYREHKLYNLPFDFIIIGNQRGISIPFFQLEALLITLKDTLNP